MLRFSELGQEVLHFSPPKNGWEVSPPSRPREAGYRRFTSKHLPMNELDGAQGLVHVGEGVVLIQQAPEMEG